MQAAFMQFEPMLASRAWSWLHLIGRLSPGASLITAEAAANVAHQQFLAENPAVDEALRRSIRIGLEPAPSGNGQREPAHPPSAGRADGGVGLLLLIVCLNVSHLMIARAIGRHHELTIRAALGAGRGRLVRQLLTEGVLMAVLGLGGAVLLARWSRRGLVALLDDGTRFGVDLSADARVWWFTAGLGAFTALVLGLMPAWRVARADPRGLRVSGRAIAGGAAAARPRVADFPGGFFRRAPGRRRAADCQPARVAGRRHRIRHLAGAAGRLESTDVRPARPSAKPGTRRPARPRGSAARGRARQHGEHHGAHSGIRSRQHQVAGAGAPAQRADRVGHPGLFRHVGDEDSSAVVRSPLEDRARSPAWWW